MAFPITKETATVTTRTTTKSVSTMVVIAVPKLWPVVKSKQSTAQRSVVDERDVVLDWTMSFFEC